MPLIERFLKVFNVIVCSAFVSCKLPDSDVRMSVVMRLLKICKLAINESNAGENAPPQQETRKLLILQTACFLLVNPKWLEWHSISRTKMKKQNTNPLFESVQSSTRLPA